MSSLIKMTFYASFLRPISPCRTHNQYVSQIIINELKLFKSLNLKKRHFMSQIIRKKSGWALKNVSKCKERLQRAQQIKVDEATPFSIQLLVKPFLFTVAFSSASLAATAIWQYENVRKKAMTFISKKWLTDKLNLYGEKQYGWRNEINKFWNQLSEGQKLFAPICFVNLVIFLAWRIPRLQPTMIKYFCSTPYSKVVCWPMVLCTFSHYNMLHLATNMYVLHNFSTGGVNILGKEQFLGLYLAGGVISSFFSYMYKAILGKQALTIGASGAVMAILAYTCAKNPDSKLVIILLPGFPFSAGTGLICVMGLDLLGLICRWKFLDHAAHLGGALTGISWCFWGNAYIWQKREPILHWWHELRSVTK